MYFEAFDPVLLQVNGDAYVRALQETMAADRRMAAMAATRRWIGERLVQMGESLAADSSLRQAPNAAHAGQQGC